jgi:hypothetical protein
VPDTVKVSRQRECDQDRDHKPAVMQPDFNSADAPEFDL